MDDWGAPGVAMENSTRHGRRTAFIGPGDDVADAQADPGVRDLLRQMGGSTLAYTSGDRLVVRKRLPFPSRTLRRARWHETKPGVWGHHDSDYTAVVEGPRIYLTTGMVEGLAEAQLNPGARDLGIEAKVGRKTYDVALERNYTLGFYPRGGGRALYTPIDDSLDPSERGNIWLGLGVAAGPRGNIAGVEREAKVRDPERFKKELARALRRYGVEIPKRERGKYKRIGRRGELLGDEPAGAGRPAGWPAPPPSKPLPKPPRDAQPDLQVTTDDGWTTYGVYYQGGGDFELRTKTGSRWIGARNPDIHNVRDLPTSGGWKPPKDKHMPRELPQAEVKRIRQGARQHEGWGAPGSGLAEGAKEQARIARERHGAILGGPGYYVTNIRGELLGTYDKKTDAKRDLKAVGLEPLKGSRGVRWEQPREKPKPVKVPKGTKAALEAKLERLKDIPEPGWGYTAVFEAQPGTYHFRFRPGRYAERFINDVYRAFPRTPRGTLWTTRSRNGNPEVVVPLAGLKESVDWGAPGAGLAEADVDIRSLERAAATGDPVAQDRLRAALNRAGRAPAGEMFYSEMIKDAAARVRAASVSLEAAARDADRLVGSVNAADVWARLSRAYAKAARSAATRLSRGARRAPSRSMRASLPPQPRDRGGGWQDEMLTAADHVNNAASIMRTIAGDVERRIGKREADTYWKAASWLSYFNDEILSTYNPHGGHYSNEKWKRPLRLEARAVLRFRGGY